MRGGFNLGCIGVCPISRDPFEGLQFSPGKLARVELALKRDKAVLSVAFAIDLYFPDETSLLHFSDELFNSIRVGSMGQLPVHGASNRAAMGLIMIKIHKVKQLHQLGAAKMHIINVFQEVEDHLLKLFFG